MLKNIIKNKNYSFFDNASDYKDAIHKSCETFEKNGVVSENYKYEIVKCVEKYGPYIVLMPGVCMPHSQEGGENVFKTDISFTRFNEKIIFDENDEDSWAKVFFTLASVNHDEHLENMQKLTEILSNEEMIEELINCDNEETLKKISEKYDL